MIPPVVAAAAASTAVGVLSSIAESATGDAKAAEPTRNDQLDRTDFLTLLVAQLQAQDPLNPMEAADFSAQLAQFSSLEQLVSIDQRLAQLAGAGSGSDPVSFLGREVAVAGGSLQVAGGESGPISFDLTEGGEVTLQLTDAAGKEVASIDLGARAAGRQAIDLDTLSDAPDLADGAYSVKLTQKTASGGVRDVAALVFGRVDGVDLEADPPVLLVGDRRVPLADVREVRQPAAA